MVLSCLAGRERRQDSRVYSTTKIIQREICGKLRLVSRILSDIFCTIVHVQCHIHNHEDSHNMHQYNYGKMCNSGIPSAIYGYVCAHTMMDRSITIVYRVYNIPTSLALVPGLPHLCGTCAFF